MLLECQESVLNVLTLISGVVVSEWSAVFPLPTVKS